MFLCCFSYLALHLFWTLFSPSEITSLVIAGILPFRVVPLTLTAENSCKCNVMVMYSLILDLLLLNQ